MSNFEHSYALIIGINDYNNGISSLKTAVSDATEIARILETEHGYTVTLLLNEAATLSELRRVLEIELPQQIQKGDRFLFYFAGHGIALNGEDGPEGYLIPQNAKSGNVSTYLPMSEVNKALLQLPCRHFLGILDCCFAGAFRWSSLRKAIPIELSGTIHKERYDRFIQDPAWQVLTSASHDQSAWDTFNLKDDRGQIGSHSPFACALIEALEGKADAFPPAAPGKPAGDGVITATDLYVYLRDRVEIATETRAIRQTPGIHCLKKHDKGEYIFLTPRHALNLPPAPPLDVSKNPYRGLSPFQEEHHKLFFGRSELIEKLQNFVKTNPLTVVLGASGAGKSSLVKAGLIPELRKEKTEKWYFMPPIRPGKTPLQALNNALKQIQLPEVEPQNSQHNLVMSIDVWAKKFPNFKLLLFVDQSEEIITLCQDEDERKEFFQQILQAINAHRDKLRVVLSLRSDFEPQVRDAGLKFIPTGDNVGNTVLKGRWVNGRFIVPAMTRKDLREAIEKPAETRVMYFQPHDLVEQLINEVADMPGALPLLSFALSELYLKYLKRQRDAGNEGITIDRALTEADYQDLGGVILSLTQRADEEYEALVKKNPAYSQVIRDVMLRMVALGGGELARRQVPLSELEYPPDRNSLVKEVIEHFSTARLLVKGQDAEGNPYVEPAHDALVRGWERLLRWVKEEEESLILQRRLTPAAVDWKSKQQPRFLWNVDPYLDVLQKEVLSSQNNNWLNQLETEFARQSIKRRRNKSITRWSLVNAAFLVLSSVAGIAINNAIDAQNRLLEASTALTEERLASKHELEALIEGIKAGERLKNMFPFVVREDTKMRVILALRKIVYDMRERNRLEGHGGAVQSVAFSPGGEVIASASADSTIKLWRRDGSILQTLTKHKDGVFSVSFSLDGQILISASSDKTINLWQRQHNNTFTLLRSITDKEGIAAVSLSPDKQTIATATNATARGKYTVKLWYYNGKLLSTFPEHNDQVRDLNFSPDGQILASASLDKTIKLWNVKNYKLVNNIKGTEKFFGVRFVDNQTIAVASADHTVQIWNLKGQQIRTLKGHTDDVLYLDVSRDGKTIASTSSDRTVKIWNLKDGQKLQNIEITNETINQASFSPDSKMIALASTDQSVYIWSRNGMVSPTILQGTSLSFSPDSQIIVSGNKDGTVKLWHRDGKWWRTFKADNKKILKVNFSPDGKTIASVSKDGTLNLWNLKGELINTLKEDKNGVLGMSFSPDSKKIALANSDNTVKLWELDKKLTLLKTFVDHNKEVKSVSFSPDGKTIASASDDRTVKLWSLDGKLVKTFPGHEDAVLDVNFSPNGKMLATASSDMTVRIWDINNQLIKNIKNDEKKGFSKAKFSPSGETLISGSSDGEIKLWNLNGTLLATLQGDKTYIFDVSFSQDGKIMGSAGYPEKVILWNLDLDDLLQHSCSWLHDYLKNKSNVTPINICHQN